MILIMAALSLSLSLSFFSLSVFRSVSPSLSLTYFQFLYRPCHIKTFNKDYGNNLKTTASEVPLEGSVWFLWERSDIELWKKTKKQKKNTSWIYSALIFNDILYLVMYACLLSFVSNIYSAKVDFPKRIISLWE